eukprot:10249961-Alexandrium_andersonii.AAC.1
MTKDSLPNSGWNFLSKVPDAWPCCTVAVPQGQSRSKAKASFTCSRLKPTDRSWWTSTATGSRGADPSRREA